jgi:hypothetical protein
MSEPTFKSRHSWTEVTGEGRICKRCGEDSWFWYQRGDAWYTKCYPCMLARGRKSSPKQVAKNKAARLYGQPEDKELCCWEVIRAKPRR